MQTFTIRHCYSYDNKLKEKILKREQVNKKFLEQRNKRYEHK